MKLTIGIKALNEERHIEACLTSAVAAARRWNGEVILADSGSSDRTIELASHFDIKIVQLKNPLDKSCGAGAQLAFQHAAGEYFYLLDGDMVLNPDFLISAFNYLDLHPSIAGVGGLLIDRHVESLEFQIRASKAKHQNFASGTVRRLDGGGLYRSSAILEVGYFADRNLKAFEEFELSARLHSRGWQLARIATHAVDHFGHQVEGYGLLWRRVKSGYMSGNGQVLRGSIGRRHFLNIILEFSNFWQSVAVIIWWIAAGMALVLPGYGLLRISFFVLLFFSPIALLSVRRKSITLGLYSFATWNLSAVGLIAGFFKRRTAPTVRLDSISISEGKRSDGNPRNLQLPLAK